MKCFLDIDVGGSREAFKNATEFVKSNNLKYRLSSDNILELGGREILSLPQLYASDFEWNQRGRMQAKPQKKTRIVIELWPDVAPLACENFAALCTGEKGKAKGSSVPLHYRGSRLHRLIPNFILQGGDFVFNNGSGGESIWGKKFKDDPKALKVKHDAKGLVSMGNAGKNANTSQFFFTLSDKGAPKCDRKHAVFGRVMSGLDVLDLIERRHTAALATGSGTETEKVGDVNDMASEVHMLETECPAVPLVITECGLFTEGVDAYQGYWNADDTFVSTSSEPDTPEES